MLLVKQKAAPLKTFCPFAVSIPQTKWNKGKKQGWLNLPVFVGEGHKSPQKRQICSFFFHFCILQYSVLLPATVYQRAALFPPFFCVKKGKRFGSGNILLKRRAGARMKAVQKCLLPLIKKAVT